MKRSLLGWIALTAVALTAVGCHRGHHGMNPEKAQAWIHGRLEAVLDDLDATAAQRQRAQELEKTLVPRGVTLHQESRQARQELMQQLRSATPDKARVHALIDERAEAYRAFAHSLADAALEMQQGLSPEQRAKLEKMTARYKR